MISRNLQRHRGLTKGGAEVYMVGGQLSRLLVQRKWSQEGTSNDSWIQIVSGQSCRWQISQGFGFFRPDVDLIPFSVQQTVLHPLEPNSNAIPGYYKTNRQKYWGEGGYKVLGRRWIKDKAPHSRWQCMLVQSLGSVRGRLQWYQKRTAVWSCHPPSWKITEGVEISNYKDVCNSHVCSSRIHKSGIETSQGICRQMSGYGN